MVAHHPHTDHPYRTSPDDTRRPGAPAGPDDAARVAQVRQYELLDRPRDGAYQRIASLATAIFDVPIGAVIVVDEDRVWFAAGEGGEVIDELSRDPGLCASIVSRDDVYVVHDALTDARTLSHPLVRGDLGLRFYAAAPIRTRDGYRLGTVCVMDREPRVTTPRQLLALEHLAALVAEELEVRLTAIQTVVRERRLRLAAEERPLSADWPR